tara:strand:- start:148 stop:405 length:258 start_codon:yes stop_codon:yes gene_type:complete
MSRKINISKYEGNTHYSVHIYDSFGQEHHIGYFNKPNSDISLKIIHNEAKKIWENEVKRVPSLMDKAIAQCIEIDIKNGMQPSLD